jgi:transposase
MVRFSGYQVVFIDESIFNEKTGWRHRRYTPIGHEARYQEDVRRGKTWSILAALTIDHRYLPCTGIKLGYFKKALFLEWVRDQSIPTLRRLDSEKIWVIVIDNCSTYIDPTVRATIEVYRYIYRFPPPYSSDFNPIELIFAVLKAWIYRYYYIKRPQAANFGDFLRLAIRESRCDWFATTQFRHAADGMYIVEGRLEELQVYLLRYEYSKGCENLIEEELNNKVDYHVQGL